MLTRKVQPYGEAELKVLAAERAQAREMAERDRVQFLEAEDERIAEEMLQDELQQDAARLGGKNPKVFNSCDDQDNPFSAVGSRSTHFVYDFRCHRLVFASRA